MSRYAEPPLTPPQIYHAFIPKGYAGTKRTVAHMKALIRAGAKDFYVRQKAIDVLLEKGVRAKDYLGEIKALFEWVQRNVRYTKDPSRVEVLHSARRMLELRAGDCDDMAILLGALLEAVGHPVRLVLTGRDPSRPRLFTHVYVEAYHKGRWVPLDATMPFPMGWAPRAMVKKIIPVKEEKNGFPVFGFTRPGRSRVGPPLATQTYPGHMAGGHARPRYSGEIPVANAAAPRLAAAQPLASDQAPLHLEAWSAGSSPTAPDPSAESAAQRLGNPACRCSGTAPGGPTAGSTCQCKAGCPGRATALTTKHAASVGSAIRSAGVQRGIALYREFNGFAPERTLKVRHSRVIPAVVVGLGELMGVIYRSDKGRPGEQRTYIHLMQDPPHLVSNVEGTQLYLVGGNYRVTPEGITG